MFNNVRTSLSYFDRKQHLSFNLPSLYIDLDFHKINPQPQLVSRYQLSIQYLWIFNLYENTYICSWLHHNTLIWQIFIILRRSERARNDIHNLEFITFRVIEVILSSLRSSQNDENPLNTSPILPTYHFSTYFQLVHWKKKNQKR